VDAPFSLTEPVDPGAQRFYGLAGVEYVVTLQQSADSGFADGKSAEDQSPMRDRFVARHANATSQCAAPAGDELGSFGLHSLKFTSFALSREPSNVRYGLFVLRALQEFGSTIRY
jgi:hypothetical protein